jgi:hypothetical protein
MVNSFFVIDESRVVLSLRTGAGPCSLDMRKV